jgi:hypothetical protein
MKLIQSVGFLDMHPLQVKALMDLVKLTIKTAAQSNEQSQVKNAEHVCDEMVRLFVRNWRFFAHYFQLN